MFHHGVVSIFQVIAFKFCAVISFCQVMNASKSSVAENQFQTNFKFVGLLAVASGEIIHRLHVA